MCRDESLKVLWNSSTSWWNELRHFPTEKHDSSAIWLKTHRSTNELCARVQKWNGNLMLEIFRECWFRHFFVCISLFMLLLFSSSNRLTYEMVLGLQGRLSFAAMPRMWQFENAGEAKAVTDCKFLPRRLLFPPRGMTSFASNFCWNSIVKWKIVQLETMTTAWDSFHLAGSETLFFFLNFNFNASWLIRKSWLWLRERETFWFLRQS